MKDVRRLPSRRPTQFEVPEDLISMRFTCPTCQLEFKHEWHKPTNFPSIPISPLAAPDSGFWVPVGITVTCPNNHISEASVPISANEGIVTLFGDDATRCFSLGDVELSIRSTALVWVHRDRRPLIQLEMDRLKRSLIPDRDPQSWPMHFTDFWSNKGAFASQTRSKAQKLAFANDLFLLCRSNQPYLGSAHMHSAIKLTDNRSADLSWQRELDFSRTLATTLQLFRSQGKVPRWIFDSEKSTGKGLRKREGNKEELFLGLQYSDVWVWLCAGAAIIKPEFREPGSDVLLEIADSLAFWAARSIQRKILQVPLEIEPDFGVAFHMWSFVEGGSLHSWRDSLPFEYFIGGK